MKYNRFLYIFQEMGNELSDKFIKEFEITLELLKDENIDEFNHCMLEFIQNNGSNKELQLLCEYFPELKNIPHPDEIPESWLISPKGREVLTLGYIVRIETEKKELQDEITELKSLINELKAENNIMQKKGKEDGPGLVQEPKNTEITEKSIAADIYEKFFIPPIARNRYQILSSIEISWIKTHAELSEADTKIFELCCKSGSLKEVSQKTGVNLSKVKHISASIVERIKFACGSIDDGVNNGTED